MTPFSLKAIAAGSGLVFALGAAVYLGGPWASGRAQGRQVVASGSEAVVARVDGEAITAAELDRHLGVEADRLFQQLHEMRRSRLDSLIADRLVAREASKRGVSVDELMRTEVLSKVAPVTDAEVDGFYETNRARLPDQPNIKDQIRAFLGSQRLNARQEEFIGSLRAAAKVSVSLDEPPLIRHSVSSEGAAARGPANAPVTIVEFSDFHCPFCRRVQPTLRDVLARYPNQVRLVYRDLPLDSLHPQARRSARAARCAGDQGKFWEYHDALYEGPSDASDATLQAAAAKVGLDASTFSSCLASEKHAEAVERDVEEATRLGAQGTPAFFVNGRFLNGAQPLEAFVDIIEDELRRGAQR